MLRNDLTGSSQIKRKKSQQLPGTKWYKNAKRKRITTGDLLNRVRMENWLESVQINLTDFAKLQQKMAKLGKINNPAIEAIFYNRN
ncbi:hypothetical protein [Leadbetterella byssophila]|uniref:hypothetical protein n=1 Tax=Leadbetterella byssophila TaxID=316068 RepID=UPI0039A04328